ncbi:MAG: dTDP-4-dehydrorhamnose 3,5-epimerase family protein [Chloroflexota bacterium]|nr:dTDP-4-dehydrorhamnose 3,5-epimerase family protein [Chloroflexota bacterium]
MTQLHGVEIKKLTTHPDERGFFREVIRASDDFFGEGFGQWSHTASYQGVVKAWHVHRKQVDWWYVASGRVKVALYDTRDRSPTSGQLQEILLGDGLEPCVLKVPPGVAHGYRVLSPEAHLFYITSRTYDPDDEGRISHDDPQIGYDWTAGPAIT